MKSMRLILTSTGFSTREIVGRCVELVGKPRHAIKVAVINEAYVEVHGDHGWLLNDLNRIKDNFGYMELVNLQALDIGQIEKRIGLADVIFATGGDPDYLMAVFGRTGFGRLLPNLLEGRVYVGSSAGSMVVGKRVDTAAYLQTYGESTAARYGVSEWLGLVDLAVHPHFEVSLSPDNRPEVLLDTAREYKGTIYAIRDDSAVVVDGDKLGVVGSEPVIVRDGRIVEKRKSKN